MRTNGGSCHCQARPAPAYSDVLESLFHAFVQLTEGIGQGRVTGNLAEWGQPTREGGVVDFWCQVSARDPARFANSSSTFPSLEGPL
jgi:hypothetical protein